MSSAGHNEPRVLLTIANVSAYHLQNGEESSLTPSGPQTLSLLMVPTSSPFADLSTADPTSEAPEEDFYLHLHLPPELDLSLPATTQIFHQLPRSYLIPRWDLGPDAGAFTRIEFPKLGSGPDRCTQDEIDTFETILAQCTAFLEKANSPFAGYGKNKDVPAYNPGDYKPGEAYIGNRESRGQIVLIDEEDGSVVGELSEGFDVVADSGVMPGSKNPVEVTLPQEGQGNRITVANVSEDYLKMTKHPAYANSTIVQNAATASRLIVTGTGYLANTINSGAFAFTQKTKPNPKPMTFSPTTQERIRKINHLTHGAVGISAATVGQVGRLAQSLGATLARRQAKAQPNAQDPMGGKGPGYKPGVLNKSMIAFSTIADGIETGARQLLESGSTAASTVVAHRYGAEAGQVAKHVAGGVKNVGLVYVDATGVSRKAVLKSVARGMVVGRVPAKDGRGELNLIVGDGDGGSIMPEMVSGSKSGEKSGVGLGTAEKPGEGVVGFGNATAPPPVYRESASGVGEPLGSSQAGGQGQGQGQGQGGGGNYDAYGYPVDRKT